MEHWVILLVVPRPWTKHIADAPSNAQITGSHPLVNIQKNYGKSPLLMGKSSINGQFSIAMLVFQRVIIIQILVNKYIYIQIFGYIWHWIEYIFSNCWKYPNRYPNNIKYKSRHWISQYFTWTCLYDIAFFYMLFEGGPGLAKINKHADKTRWTHQHQKRGTSRNSICSELS